MNGFLIDTNVLSEYNLPGPDPGVRAWLETTHRSLQFVSVLTLAEIQKGIALLEPGRRRASLEQWLRHDLEEWFAGRILPVDRLVSDHWAILTAKRSIAGKPLPAIDSLIAATAIAHGLAIVTRNTKDFEGIGLLTVNPWDSVSP
ncbi:MAG: type II toxin-antitoxin system VapC family toxin [Acidobacteria bacterium]|nr:type II toxin-antitoxin system VapC family toxin [Acidobacteriota bacterium]